MTLCQDCQSADCEKAAMLRRLREVLAQDLHKLTDAASSRDKAARGDLYDAQDACHRRHLARTP